VEKRRIKHIALYPALNKSIADPINKIALWFKNKKISLYMPQESAKFFNLSIGAKDKEILSKADLILSLGGDGTFLRAARYVCGFDINVLGVNLGSKGFLTEISMDDMDESFNLLLNEKYKIENRVMLDCLIMRRGKKIFSGTALNEVVVAKGGFEHLLNIKTYINENYAASFIADGLIVSTPTGSTAYSISAGGPIVSADADCFVMSAICPHTLSARPLVVSSDDVINIKEEKSPKVDVIIDGQIKFVSLKKDDIEVKKSKKITKIIRIKKDFYQIVREKLKWVE